MTLHYLLRNSYNLLNRFLARKAVTMDSYYLAIVYLKVAAL